MEAMEEANVVIWKAEPEEGGRWSEAPMMGGDASSESLARRGDDVSHLWATSVLKRDFGSRYLFDVDVCLLTIARKYCRWLTSSVVARRN